MRKYLVKGNRLDKNTLLVSERIDRMVPDDEKATEA